MSAARDAETQPTTATRATEAVVPALGDDGDDGSRDDAGAIDPPGGDDSDHSRNADLVPAVDEVRAGDLVLDEEREEDAAPESLPSLLSSKKDGAAVVVPTSDASRVARDRDAATSSRLTSALASSVMSRRSLALASSQSLRTATGLVAKHVLAQQRVVKYGFSLPVIFVFSVAIGVSYAIAYVAVDGNDWVPRDLSGSREWTSYTRTHLVQDPLVLLAELLNPATVGVDTSVNVNFVAKYGVANEADVASTAATFNRTWLEPSFILANGFAVAGQMAGAFEGYGAWPCALVLAAYPVLALVCPEPATDWFKVQIYNNPVATSSEKASTYLSLDYTPMALLTARVWRMDAPTLLAGDGIRIRGYKEGTFKERAHFVIKSQGGVLALAPVTACPSATQSNARECDHLEGDDVYVRNYARRDQQPPGKLNKLKVYGPALAMGHFVAAGKSFVQLPATATVMTDTGYSATTRFSTTFAHRFTIVKGKLTTEAHIPQVAQFTKAVGNGFATATAQMAVVCLIVFNAIAHCHTTDEIVAREGRIFGFRNHITLGIVARRLGTYKLVFVQLCVYHYLNVGKYFSAVFNRTQKTTDTIAFGAEGFLLVVVSTMLLDQLIFVERYSSVREFLSVTLSCALYMLLMYLNSSYFLSATQVAVTERAICARANQCMVLNGYSYYYAGLAVALVAPVFLINGPVDRLLIRTRSRDPKTFVTEDHLTSFEAFCVGRDARREFGGFDRSPGAPNATPLSVVHAAGFTFVGPYLVRIKDFYMVVLARVLPRILINTCGLTLTVFKMEKGRIVSGRHMVLAVAAELFRDAKHEHYEPIP